MDVSENSDTPKSSILIGFSIINHPFWATPIFGNTHITMVIVSPNAIVETPGPAEPMPEELLSSMARRHLSHLSMPWKHSTLMERSSSQATTLTQGATPQDIATLQLYYQNPPPLQPPPSWARGFWRCIWSHWTQTCWS